MIRVFGKEGKLWVGIYNCTVEISDLLQWVVYISDVVCNLRLAFIPFGFKKF